MKENLPEYDVYGVLISADDSILNLDRTLARYQCKLLKVELPELESNYSELFGLPKGFSTSVKIRYENGIEISQEFHRALHRNHLLHSALQYQDCAYLVQRLHGFNFTYPASNGAFNHEAVNFHEFLRRLVLQLRLHKTGSIASPGHFAIERTTRKIGSTMSTYLVEPYRSSCFTITPQESEEFYNKFDPNKVYPSLVELAISNFTISYYINDLPAKYIILMTALESLFNQGKDQIAHTISRHLSIIISRSHSEFQINYKRIKKLYSYRSTIVHGDKISENLKSLISELEEHVRSAINFCSAFKGTKQDLFEKLNSTGYSI